MLALNIGKITYDITIPMDKYPVENSKIILKEKLEASGVLLPMLPPCLVNGM